VLAVKRRGRFRLICYLRTFVVTWPLADGPVQFPPHQVYGADDRGVIGVESLGPQGLGLFVIHTVLDVRTVV
jgi:hypothetical protein